MCSHCGVTGHTIEKCYWIHDFPPGYRFNRPKPTGEHSAHFGQNDAQSIIASSAVHGAYENQSMVLTHKQGQQLLSLLKPQPIPVANLPTAFQVGGSIIMDSLFSTMGGNTSKFYVFSSHKIIPLSAPNSWIIGTGALDHMICSLSLFTTIIAEISTQVKLPNGKFSIVSHIWTAQLSAHLILTNVLYIPCLSYNLLSVSKLTQSLACCFLFFC